MCNQNIISNKFYLKLVIMFSSYLGCEPPASWRQRPGFADAPHEFQSVWWGHRYTPQRCLYLWQLVPPAVGRLIAPMWAPWTQPCTQIAPFLVQWRPCRAVTSDQAPFARNPRWGPGWWRLLIPLVLSQKYILAQLSWNTYPHKY